ncbi:MAG: hypothetical protein O3A63_01600 [Proteobacteria bacterium]|nr:hypothetical protein [Pseudomonadota bacterium]
MSDYLQVIKQTEHFIASQALDTPQGLSWRRVPEGQPSHSLYHGSAGVIVFYLELYRHVNDPVYLQKAVDAGHELVAYVQQKVASESFVTIGLHSGWPGYVFVLNELFKACGEAQFRDTAIAALNRISAQASDIGAGIGWSRPRLQTSPASKVSARSLICQWVRRVPVSSICTPIAKI